MRKIQEIIKKMTFEQKARFLTGDNENSTVAFEELGIPKITFCDGPHGVRYKETKIPGGCTCMPTASSTGASWNRELVFRLGKALAYECIENGFDMLLAPGVNMKRTPFCGRNFEYFSEDPVLSGELGAAYINGLDSEGIGTSLKHFAANNQEYEARTINAEIDERTLMEYYLKPFETVIEKSNPSSVMCAYNKLNGIWCSENRYLLQTVLRDDWGYDGMVISDWGAVHNSAKAVAAGLNLEMPKNPDMANELKKAVDMGIITEEEIDRAAEGLLNFVFKISERKKKQHEYSRKKQHEFARELSGESIVLLKNENNVLPINGKKYKKICVAGKLAKRPVFIGSGSSKVETDDSLIDKPLDFIEEYCKNEGIELVYDAVYDDGYMGAEMVGDLNAMEHNVYDAIIVFIGDNYGAETETEFWDRDSIRFANYMNGIVRAANKACDNVIVVMQTGSAAIPVRWEKDAKGILQMWYSGEGGGKAVADILFGKINPSGKLSETFVLKERTDVDRIGDGLKTWYREGMFVGYRYYDRHPEDIWFPFGHGLSYTQFKYSDIVLKRCEGGAEVSCKIRNIGTVGGKEVVQLYVAHKNSVVMRPDKELKAFDKIYLNPGEEKTVSFKLDMRAFAYYNVCLRKWYTENGTYNILIGASSRDIRLTAEYVHNDKKGYSVDSELSVMTML